MEIQVVNTHEKGLEKVLPRGLLLDISSPITLITGENGRGKTAFLRLVNDSLVNSHYFRYWEISYLWNAVKNDKELARKLFPMIKKEVLKKRLEEEDDENVFGFLRIIDKFSLYPFCYQSPLSKLVDSSSSHETGSVYDNLFRLKFNRKKSPGQKNISSLEEFFESVERFYVPHWDLMQLEYKTTRGEIIRPNYLVQDTAADDSVFSWFRGRNWGRNPAFNVLSRIKGFRCSPLQLSSYDPEDDNKPLFSLKSRDEKDIAPVDSQAVVLMDEPTLFMSYSNQRNAREGIVRFSSQYPRMKIFIATNDASLIEHAGEMRCGLIDFDKDPVLYSLPS